MPWCPVCKLEYVEGISVCPDCKSALVDSLEEAVSLETSENPDELDEETAEEIAGEFVQSIDDEELKAEMMERMKKIMDNPPYKSKEEQLTENKSGATVLIACGMVGVIVLVLNALGVISLPVKGFSLTLTYTVMGCLFFVFLVSGVRSAFKVKQLKPEAQKEKEDIDKILEFLKGRKAEGCYALREDVEKEEAYLEVSDKAVEDINAEFSELEPGFAFYVVDRFGNEVLDED